MHNINRVILLVISSIGSDSTLADLFEGGGLTDLFTSHEPGIEENFLVDLFVLLVISLLCCYVYYVTGINFIVHNVKRNLSHIGTKYDFGRIDQSTSRSVGAYRSSSKTATRIPTVHVLERFIVGCPSRSSDGTFTFSITTSHSESSSVRRRCQRQEWVAH